MVYHYTSPDSLYAILKNKSLRFTDCQYMNDESEFMYIKNPFLHALKECESELKYKHYKKLIELTFSNEYGTKYRYYMSPNNDNPQGKIVKNNNRHYIFCTSISDDSLGMWNYYVKGENYQGYNIGLHIDLLIAKAVNQSNKFLNYTVKHQEVIYDVKKQISLLVEFLREIDKNFFSYFDNVNPKDLGEDSYISAAKSLFSKELDSRFYRLLFKHPTFADEREYRFILSIPEDQINSNKSTFKKDYFIRNGIITPCCMLKFNEECIENITVSPTMELELVKYSTQSFLKDNGYEHSIHIKQSEIPIRY